MYDAVTLWECSSHQHIRWVRYWSLCDLFELSNFLKVRFYCEHTNSPGIACIMLSTSKSQLYLYKSGFLIQILQNCILYDNSHCIHLYLKIFNKRLCSEVLKPTSTKFIYICCTIIFISTHTPFTALSLGVRVIKPLEDQLHCLVPVSVIAGRYHSGSILTFV